MMENKLPKRKNNRLSGYDYSISGVYFITVCTKEKRCLFWTKHQFDFVGEDSILPPDVVCLTDYGCIVKNAIVDIEKHYADVKLLQYAIMPNHIHLLLSIPYESGRIISSPTNIIKVIGQLKRTVSKQIGHSIWQKSFHDHIIRNQNDFEDVSKYVYENPAKWQYDCFYQK